MNHIISVLESDSRFSSIYVHIEADPVKTAGAKAFYTSKGFTFKEKVNGYYKENTGLSPDAEILEKVK